MIQSACIMYAQCIKPTLLSSILLDWDRGTTALESSHSLTRRRFSYGLFDLWGLPHYCVHTSSEGVCSQCNTSKLVLGTQLHGGGYPSGHFGAWLWGCWCSDEDVRYRLSDLLTPYPCTLVQTAGEVCLFREQFYLTDRGILWERQEEMFLNLQLW